MHTLPRRDRTFTGADIIRFYCRNLDGREQFEVVLFFTFIAFPIQIERITSTIEDILSEIPVLRGTTRFLTILNRALRITAGVSPRILANLFDSETFDVIVDCLEDL